MNTLAFIGEHNNMEPYSWKYQNSNVSAIRHLLGENQNNNISRWTVGLRDSYNDNNSGKNYFKNSTSNKNKSAEHTEKSKIARNKDKKKSN